ncbi:MAG: FAD-binding oxidoreductase [Desulfatibacillaceae bacterium]|nr:FAD-binding oxidoreductase [Desulfatibacillaceae bacterium]
MIKENYREKSYWLTTRDYQEDAPLEGDIRVDVAIVGGGFTGLTTAHFLKKAEPSLNVALLESQVIGFGASGRNGGFNMTLFGLTMGITALRFGRAKAREAHLYMERAVDTLKALVEENSIDCDYEHPGFLRVATSPQYARRIRHEIELAHELGLGGIEWIDQDAVREQVNSPTYLGAWSEPRCGLINPAKLSWGWKGVIKGQGVAVYERSPVISMSKTGSNRVILTTPNGRVDAAKVVLATNAYSHLVPGIKWKQVPIWTHIVLTEPLTQKQLEPIGWKNRQGVEDARNLVHYYRLTADNRLLMGGRDISFAYGYNMDKDINESVFKGLKKDVAQIFPSLADVRYTHQWGGPVSVTTDLTPAMGYLGSKNVIYSVGCMGHGVSLTHLNGATAADLALEKKTDLTDTFFVNRRVFPWPPEPLRMVASKAILAAMHVQDKLCD